MSDRLSPADRELLRSFQFTQAQKAEVWDAWLASADGVERCALKARAEGSRVAGTGAGLLLTMLRRGEHLIGEDESALRVTGWRFVRGSHSGHYVRDHAGTDALPPGYDIRPTLHHGREALQ